MNISHWAKVIILILALAMGVNIYALNTGEIKADVDLYNVLFKITVVMGIALCYFIYCYICAVIEYRDAEWKDDNGSDD